MRRLVTSAGTTGYTLSWVVSLAVSPTQSVLYPKTSLPIPSGILPQIRMLARRPISCWLRADFSVQDAERHGFAGGTGAKAGKACPWSRGEMAHRRIWPAGF